MMKKEEKRNCTIVAVLFACALIFAILYYIVNTISSAINARYAQSISIPVILNYEGDAWIDQRGEIMETEAAEDFLKNNVRYATDILYLNGNPCYASGLRNKERTTVIEELRQKYVTSRTEDWQDNRDLADYVTVLQGLIANPPTDDAFQKLFAHLGKNAAIYDVEDLQNLCQEGKLDTGFTEPKTEPNAEYLFFWVLAENYDSGRLEAACGHSITRITIPAVLAADNETWMDQNGQLISEVEAKRYLAENRDYAVKILNLNKMPLFPSWQNDARSEAIDQLWTDLNLSHSRPDDPPISFADYISMLQYDIREDRPSIKILEEYQEKLKLNSEATYIASLIDYLERYDTYYPKAFNAPSFAFWNAIAKITERAESQD